MKEIRQLPGKDLTRWDEIAPNIWIRKLGGDSELGVKATKAAIELATALDINLAHVKGSGKDGKILKSDVEPYA